MSFILKDKKLIEELIRHAQAATPTKPAAQEPDPAKVKALALKLMGNLESQINAPPFTADKDSNVRMNNLQSLEQFLTFLSYNNVKYSGNPIVIKHDAQAGTPGVGYSGGAGNAAFLALPKDVQAQYAKYPEPQTDEGEDFKYWINKTGAVSYIQYLQKQAGDTKNQLMTAVVGKLAQQLNDLGIDTTAKPAVGSKLNAAAPLDSILESIVFSAPYEMGSNDILQKDLASRGSLFQFLSSHNIGIVNGNEKKQTKDLDGADMCSIVQVLYLRAKKYWDTRNDEAAKVYLQLITNLASSMGCDLGHAPVQNANYQQVGYVTQGGALTDQGVTTMKQVEMPLVSNQIVFERIERFTAQFKQIYPQAPVIQTVEAAIAKLKSKYPSITAQDLNTTNFDEVSKLIQDTNSGGNGADYISTLGTLLQTTQQMLMVLAEMTRRNGSIGALTFKKEVDDQVQNVYTNNMYGVRKLQGQLNNNLNDVARQVGKRQTW